MTEASFINVGLAIALVGGLMALLRYINEQITQERLWREEADAKLREEMEESATKLETTLARIIDEQATRHTLIYQEYLRGQKEIAEKYATRDEVDRSEGRTAVAVDKLTARTELLITRVEGLAVDLARGNSKRTTT